MASSFGKMQQMRLPEGAIRQKMASNGLSDEDIAIFFGEAPAAPAPAPAPVVVAPWKAEPGKCPHPPVFWPAPTVHSADTPVVQRWVHPRRHSGVTDLRM